MRNQMIWAVACTLAIIMLGDAVAEAQTAQFTINGVTTTVPLSLEGSGNWSGSSLSPLPENIVVSFSSLVDPFLLTRPFTPLERGNVVVTSHPSRGPR